MSPPQVKCVSLRILPQTNLAQRQEGISVESKRPDCPQYGLHIEQV